MYAWKWWRENRSRAIAYLIVVAALAVFLPWMNPKGFPNAAGRARELGAEEMWRFALAGFGSLVCIFAGLSLGATGVGDEFAQGTLDFLLTKPRSRKYFVWAGWLAGAGTLLMMAALAVLLSLVNLAFVTKSLPNWKLLAIIIPLFVLSVVAYSLTYFMTALTKSARSGLSFGLGLIVIAELLPVAGYAEWQIDLPSLFSVLETSRWATGQGAHFPLAATIGWSLVALAFPFATQFLFQRVEV